MMCYYLNVQFQGQRVKNGGKFRAVTTSDGLIQTSFQLYYKTGQQKMGVLIIQLHSRRSLLLRVT